MLRWLRRFILLVLIGGIGAACYTAWHRRQAERPSAVWSPVDPTPLRLGGDEPPPDRVPVDDSAGADLPTSTWVPAVEGACPTGYPIKAKAKTGIYHVPGGRSYDRTVPERCYASAADAEADGYRAAKS